MPGKATSPEPPTDSEAQASAEASTTTQESKFTDEWHQSVEKRFYDLGEFIRSGRATHATTQQTSAEASTEANEGDSAFDATSNGQAAIGGSARDTRPPRPNHWWFRNLGG